MPFALCLDLGGPDLGPVHAAIRLIEAASRESRSVLQLGIGLHLTLAVVETLPEDAASQLLDSADAHPLEPIRFPAWGVFPGERAVVFLTPLASDALRGLQRDCHDAASRFGTPCSHYHPESWVPHATLAVDVPGAELHRVVPCLARLRFPLTLDAVSAGVVEVPSVRTVARRPRTVR
jgi:2'-5' RNA ligase